MKKLPSPQEPARGVFPGALAQKRLNAFRKNCFARNDGAFFCKWVDAHLNSIFFLTHFYLTQPCGLAARPGFKDGVRNASHAGDLRDVVHADNMRAA
jgi:hypothetical protein